MSVLADAIAGDLIEELSAELDALGADMVADIRESISVRVERRGSRIIRSRPGEPPRYDTGDLWSRVQMEVSSDRSARSVRLEVYITGDVARYLEDGTSRMDPRPFFLPAWLRWVDRVAGRLATKLR